MTALNELMRTTLSTEQVRRVDRIAIDDFGMDSLVLMENAALGCVQWLLERSQHPERTVILCGRGNNGGDGLAMARHLQLHGWNCQLFVQGPVERLSTNNQCNLRIIAPTEASEEEHELTTSVVETALDDSLQAIGEADLIIDAMLGSGASGDPRTPFAEWIQAANESSAFRLALDVPTGVSADSGQLGSPYFAAHATLTFVAPKPGMTNLETKAYFGELTVIPIGIPARMVRRLLREFKPDS